MNNRTFFALLITFTLSGCMPALEQASEQVVSMPQPAAPLETAVDHKMPELPFHVDLNENWRLAEDEAIYSWTYGIALEGGVIFVKVPVQAELSTLVDEDSEVYSNEDGSIVSFCDSGRCLISLKGSEDRYWAMMKDHELPIVRGERAIEQIFDKLELD